MERCKTDPRIFRRIVGGELEPILAPYVDDILVGGEESVFDGLLAKVNDTFPASELGEVKRYAELPSTVKWSWEPSRYMQTAFIYRYYSVLRFGVTTVYGIQPWFDFCRTNGGLTECRPALQGGYRLLDTAGHDDKAGYRQRCESCGEVLARPEHTALAGGIEDR